MPLQEIDALRAWENVYSQKSLSFWPGGGAYPFSPANPRCSPTFAMERGSRVFTIGSCFARAIERQLKIHDFDVVTHRYFHGWGTINKYNCYSMLDEFRWELGRKPRINTEDRLFRIGDDAYMDMHLHDGGEPSTMEESVKQINQSNAMYSEIRGCPYFIVTLGLSEVWYDKKTDTYLNEPCNIVKHYKNNPAVQSAFAERFVFRVLNYQETYAACRELMTLMQEVSPGCKALLTVSPVPIGATFTGQDVLVANTYSKSVLRVAAEQIAHDFDFVDYFPSYESVMLSARDITWDPDNAHVKEEIVALNVGRMIEAYVSA